MRRAASQPLLKHLLEGNEEEEEEEPELKTNGKALREIDSFAKQVGGCIPLHKRDPTKPRAELRDESMSTTNAWIQVGVRLRGVSKNNSPICVLPGEKYGTWKHGQKAGAARLKKQLKSRWAIQKLIDEQLAQFQAHYSRALAPTRMADMVQILMPKWIPAHELAAVSWLGDWRPSTILELLRSLFHFLWDPVGIELTLSQLINDIRIEEAVIDEEMTEIQSNCVLNLPFGVRRSEEVGPPLAQVMSEFKKIHRVIVKAQNLRMKALELAVKKVLSQTDAAEFLVAFVGIQDAVHEFSMKYKARSGPVSIKDLGVQSPGRLEYRV